jgi:hypothetical protein
VIPGTAGTDTSNNGLNSVPEPLSRFANGTSRCRPAFSSSSSTIWFIYVKLFGVIAFLLGTTVAATAEMIPLPRARPPDIPVDQSSTVSPRQVRLAEIADWCEQHGMPVMAYSPLGGPRAGLLRDPTLGRGGASRGCSAAVVALAWSIRSDSVIAIPESGSVAHMKENAVALSLTLTPRSCKHWMRRIRQAVRLRISSSCSVASLSDSTAGEGSNTAKKTLHRVTYFRATVLARPSQDSPLAEPAGSSIRRPMKENAPGSFMLPARSRWR